MEVHISEGLNTRWFWNFHLFFLIKIRRSREDKAFKRDEMKDAEIQKTFHLIVLLIIVRADESRMKETYTLSGEWVDDISFMFFLKKILFQS